MRYRRRASIKELSLEPCDVVLTAGDGLLARGIRWATREDGERPTKVNHVGMVVGQDRHGAPMIIEALQKVRHHRLDRYADTKNEVMIARPVGLNNTEKKVMLLYLEAHVGDTYGYGKIALHALRKFGIRWLDKIQRFQVERWPICSYLVAKAFERIGLDFGVEAGLATPDDIYDFITSNPDKYEIVLGLQHVTY